MGKIFSIKQFKKTICVITIIIFSSLFLNFIQIDAIKGKAKINSKEEQFRGVDVLTKSKNKCILIFAPHPDNEIIATGGLIQKL